jgi:hypothetical protein
VVLLIIFSRRLIKSKLRQVPASFADTENIAPDELKVSFYQSENDGSLQNMRSRINRVIRWLVINSVLFWTMVGLWNYNFHENFDCDDLFYTAKYFSFFLRGRSDSAVIYSTIKCVSVLGYSWIISYLFLSFRGTDAKDRKLGKDDVQFVSDNEESTGRRGYTDDVFWNDQRIGESNQGYPRKFQTVIEKNNDSENWNSIAGG